MGNAAASYNADEIDAQIAEDIRRADASWDRLVARRQLHQRRLDAGKHPLELLQERLGRQFIRVGRKLVQGVETKVAQRLERLRAGGQAQGDVGCQQALDGQLPGVDLDQQPAVDAERLFDLGHDVDPPTAEPTTAKPDVSTVDTEPGTWLETPACIDQQAVPEGRVVFHIVTREYAEVYGPADLAAALIAPEPGGYIVLELAAEKLRAALRKHGVLV